MTTPDLDRCFLGNKEPPVCDNLDGQDPSNNITHVVSPHHVRFQGDGAYINILSWFVGALKEGYRPQWSFDVACADFCFSDKSNGLFFPPGHGFTWSSLFFPAC